MASGGTSGRSGWISGGGLLRTSWKCSLQRLINISQDCAFLVLNGFALGAFLSTEQFRGVIHFLHVIHLSCLLCFLSSAADSLFFILLSTSQFILW